MREIANINLKICLEKILELSKGEPSQKVFFTQRAVTDLVCPGYYRQFEMTLVQVNLDALSSQGLIDRVEVTSANKKEKIRGNNYRVGYRVVSSNYLKAEEWIKSQGNGA